jgi:glutathione S-transferase
MAEVILYASIASRSLTAFWMMEELGVPYEWRETDLKKRQHKSPEYLKINPQGRVPSLVIDGQIVTERPAICAILADRFSYGDLAPKIEDPLRGPYYKWLHYTGAVLDPALCVAAVQVTVLQATWNALPDVIEELRGALAGKDYILGERFTAADVALGSVLAMAAFNARMPTPAPIDAYLARLQARPALQRAVAKTFPPHVIEEARRREQEQGG